jgi:uncharacterized protein
VDALWITDAAEPEPLIYGMVKALFNPANRSVLDMEKVGVHFFEAGAAASVRMPIHPGATRYYRETGVLKPQGEKASLPEITPKKS